MGERFDAIVVGAGIAGCSAAITMAREGLSVLLLERGAEPGVKNLSGGILWGGALDRVVPGWRTEAPLERFVSQKRLAFLTPDSAVGVDFRSADWERSPHNGYTLLRSKFDPWLAKKAEEAGVTLFTGLPIRGLARENGRVTGVVESGDTVRADAVVLADGANSRLMLSEGMAGRPRFGPADLELGVKEVISLPRKTIEERFHLSGESGFAMECVLGFLPNGTQAGGFLYTNKETLSLGVVVNIEALAAAGHRASNGSPGTPPSHEIVEMFRNHPSIAPLVEGGEVVEFGARPIPAGLNVLLPPRRLDGFYNLLDSAWGLLGAGSAAGVGRDMAALRGKLYGDGFLVAGDAGGFCFSNGFVIQGMNYAALSGAAAGRTVAEAKKKGDFSAEALGLYLHLLEEDHVLSDFRRFKTVPRAVWNPRMHSAYPALMADVFKEMFTERGQPKSKAWKIVLKAARKHGVSPVQLARDAASGGLNF